MTKFQDTIKKFNGMYKVPCNEKPTLDIGVPAVDRLKAFKDILTEEVNEIDLIIDKLTAPMEKTERKNTAKQLEILTDLTDLLGDIQVYCASEMAKFGLPLDKTLDIIMQSNFSKLDENGQPIYDERGKILKGPLYWKPEPKLSKMLKAKMKSK